MCVRTALDTLARAFVLDLVVDDEVLSLLERGVTSLATLTDVALVVGDDSPAPIFTRVAENELPRTVTIGFIDGTADYRKITAVSRRLAGQAQADAGLDVAMVAPSGLASGLAERWLQDAWAG